MESIYYITSFYCYEGKYQRYVEVVLRQMLALHSTSFHIALSIFGLTIPPVFILGADLNLLDYISVIIPWEEKGEDTNRVKFDKHDQLFECLWQYYVEKLFKKH